MEVLLLWSPLLLLLRLRLRLRLLRSLAWLLLPLLNLLKLLQMLRNGSGGGLLDKGGLMVAGVVMRVSIWLGRMGKIVC